MVLGLCSLYVHEAKSMKQNCFQYAGVGIKWILFSDSTLTSTNDIVAF